MPDPASSPQKPPSALHQPATDLPPTTTASPDFPVTGDASPRTAGGVQAAEVDCGSVRRGTVYLVGAGPGDLGLVTRRAESLIRDCDALVYDYLANPALLTWCRRDCQQICVGKSPGRHSKPQGEVEELLVDLAGQGKSVVRLKGGDPFIFGRGGEEMERLFAAGVPYEVVPAVTAALGAAAYAGYPLTHRDHASSVTFLTGHEDPKKGGLALDARPFAKLGGTLCVYMGVGTLPELVSQLTEGGMPPETPAAVVEWATLGRQRALRATLSTVVEAVETFGLKAPAIITLGAVAGLNPAMAFFGKGPLAGVTVATTRAQQQGAGLAQRLTAMGADVIELPLIAITEAPPSVAEADVLDNLSSYQWLIFTSANGVHWFFAKLRRRFRDLRVLGGLRIACVGEATKTAVESHFLEVDVTPTTPTADGLAETLLAEHDLENYNCLVVTGNRNRPELVEKLTAGRAIVDTLEVYRTALSDLAEDPAATDFRLRGADYITFTSTSTVESFVGQAAHLRLEKGAKLPKAISIGPQTTAKLKAFGVPVAAEAATATIEALAEAVGKAAAKVSG